MNSSYASSFNPDDKVKLLRAIKKDSKASDSNSTEWLDKLLREAIVHSIDHEVDRVQSKYAERKSKASEAAKEAELLLSTAFLKKALMMWTLNEDLQAARQMAERSYELRKKLLGECHRTTAFALAILGGIIITQSGAATTKPDFQLACDLGKEAFVAFKTVRLAGSLGMSRWIESSCISSPLTEWLIMMLLLLQSSSMTGSPNLRDSRFVAQGREEGPAVGSGVEQLLERSGL